MLNEIGITTYIFQTAYSDLFKFTYIYIYFQTIHSKSLRSNNYSYIVVSISEKVNGRRGQLPAPNICLLSLSLFGQALQ